MYLAIYVHVFTMVQENKDLCKVNSPQLKSLTPENAQ
jgi:hypothetical protein